mgnify:FL=1
MYENVTRLMGHFLVYQKTDEQSDQNQAEDDVFVRHGNLLAVFTISRYASSFAIRMRSFRDS